MTVITRVYGTYVEARRACDAVNGLNLPDVEASLLGNETMRTYHESYQARLTDPATGARVRDVADEASGTETGAGIGAAVGGGAGLLAGLGILAIPGLGPVVAAGWLAAATIGALGGAVAGGAVGALTDIGISETDAPVYFEAIRRGSMLVSVRFPESRRSEVEQALNQVPATTIDRLRRDYESAGWRGDDTQSGTRSPLYVPPVP